jgi:hypothetical protein
MEPKPNGNDTSYGFMAKRLRKFGGMKAQVKRYASLYKYTMLLGSSKTGVKRIMNNLNRKWLVSGLLILVMIPVLLSTIPSFQVSASRACIAYCGGNGGGHSGGGNGPHTTETRNLDYSNSTTTTDTSSAISSSESTP